MRKIVNLIAQIQAHKHKTWGKCLKSFGAAELQYEEACTQFAGGGSLPTGKEEEWEYVEDAEEWRVDAAYMAVLPALSC